MLGFFGNLVIALEHNPNMETALEFAADHLGMVGGREVRKAMARGLLAGRAVGPAEILSGCGWDELARPAELLEMAASEGCRERRSLILDRAMSSVLSHVREKVVDFFERIKLPSLIVFGIGVLVPLVLVLLLPTLSFLGGPALPQMVLVYCLLLPAALLFMTERITEGRPEFIEPPDVGIERPLLPVVLVLAAAAAAVLLLLHGELAVFLALWLSVSAVSAALLTAGLRPLRTRIEIERIEEEFPDFLLEVGNRLSDGKPIEKAIADYGRDKGTPLGRVVRGAAAEAASGSGLQGLLGRIGGKSRTITGGVRLLLASAERGGWEAGKTVVRISEHMRRILELKREMRRTFADLLSTMRSLAVFFAPVLTAFTARMYEVIQGGAVLLRSSPSTSPVVALAAYSVILAALLVDYGVRLERGRDMPVRCVSVAVAMPVALGVFTVSWIVSRILFGILVG